MVVNNHFLNLTYYNMKTKEKYICSDFYDRHICVCAIITDMPLFKKTKVGGIYFYSGTIIVGTSRKIEFGYSIKNPSDVHNIDLAKKIAKGRALSNKSAGFIETDNPMLVNVDFIEQQLNKLIEDIKENPSKYIKGYKDGNTIKEK